MCVFTCPQMCVPRAHMCVCVCPTHMCVLIGHVFAFKENSRLLSARVCVPGAHICECSRARMCVLTCIQVYICVFHVYARVCAQVNRFVFHVNGDVFCI